MTTAPLGHSVPRGRYRIGAIVPLNPGNVTLTFSPPGNFIVDKYHTAPASQGLTSFSQSGCSAQTIRVKDKIDNTAYAEATHEVFTPWNTDTDTVGAEWTVLNGSNKYRVLGTYKISDSWNRCYQIQFICKAEQG